MRPLYGAHLGAPSASRFVSPSASNATDSALDAPGVRELDRRFELADVPLALGPVALRRCYLDVAARLLEHVAELRVRVLEVVDEVGGGDNASVHVEADHEKVKHELVLESLARW